MSPNWRRASLLSSIERDVLAALRRSIAALDGVETRWRDDRVLGSIALAFRQHGMVTAEQESLYATADEALFLAGLAARQRKRSVRDQLTDPAFDASLRNYADRLLRGGCRLPFRAMMAPSAAHERAAATESKVDIGDGHARDGSTARWRLIRFVYSRGEVTSADLLTLSVSRQYISQLKKRGVLARIAFGQYRLGDAYLGAPVSAGGSADR